MEYIYSTDTLSPHIELIVHLSDMMDNIAYFVVFIGQDWFVKNLSDKIDKDRIIVQYL